MDISYIEYLIYSLISILIVYVTGVLIYGLFLKENHKPTYQDTFYQYIFGFFTIILFYSIFKTHGFTINITILLLCIIYGKRYKIKFKKKQVFFLEGFIFSIVLLLFWYTYMYFSHYDWCSQQVYNFDLDAPIYSSIAERLNFTGIESNMANTFYKEPIRNLYHFGDLWLIAFFTSFFKINAFLSSWLLLIPMQLMLFSLGVISVCMSILKDRYKKFILAISIPVLFLPNLCSSFSAQYIDQTSWSWVFGYTLMDSNKFLIVANCFVLIVLQLLNNQIRNTVLACCLCIIIHFGTIAALGLGLLMYFSVMFVTKKYKFKEILYFLSPFLITSFFIISYDITISKINNQYLYYIPQTASTLTKINFKDYHVYADIFYTFIDWFESEFLRLSLFILTSILLLKKYFNKTQYSQAWLFIICIIFSGTILASVLYFLPDAFQLLTLVYVPLGILFSLVTMIYFILHFDKIAVILFSLVLVISVAQNIRIQIDNYKKKEMIDTKFRAQVINISKNNDSYCFASLLNTDKKKDDVWFANSNMYYPLSYLSVYINRYAPYCISVFDNYQQSNPAIKDYKKQILFHSVFYKFVNLQIKNKEFISLYKSQEDFIRVAKIKYLIVEKGAQVPENVEKLIKYSYKDQINNTAFCILN